MIVECGRCHEPFDYWEEGTKGWIPKVPEAIVCPNCGAVHGHLKTIGYVRSRKLTDEQRQAHLKSRNDAP
jgi:hypothetical protein